MRQNQKPLAARAAGARCFAAAAAALPCLFLLPLGGLLPLFPLPAARALLVEKTAIQAGDRMISLLDIQSFRRQLRAGLVPDSILFKVFPKKQLLRDDGLLMEFLAFREAARLRAEESPEAKKFEPSGDQILAAAAALRGRLSPKAFDKKLKAHGFLPLKPQRPLKPLKPLRAKNPSAASAPKSLLKELRDSLKAEFVLAQEAASKAFVSDSDISRHYLRTAGRSQSAKNFEYELSSVSFAGGPGGRKKAEAFHRALLRSSFEEAADKAGLKARAARLRDSEMSAEIKKALRGLSVSQSSSPARIGGRIYVFHLKWKAPLLSRLEERERARIQELLFEEELKKQLKKWLAQNREGLRAWI